MTFETRSAAVVALALLVTVAAVPSVAAAESRVGETVVVNEGETVEDDLSAFSGSVVIRGTVAGDVSALSGDVSVVETGRVNGSVSAAAGNVRIAGTVAGEVSAAAGNLAITEGARIGGDVAAGAGSLSIENGATVAGELTAGAQRAAINGTVEGGAEIGADRIRLGSGAVIGGDFVYDGDLRRAEGAVVRGAVERDPDLVTGPTVGWDVGPIAPWWAFDVYGLLVNAALGAVLLLAFRGFSRRVARRATTAPARSGGVGLLAVVGVPILLVLVAVTIVGIPLALLGGFLFGLFAWIGAMYGRFAVGSALTSYAGIDSDWVALGVGLVAVALATQIPFVGWLVDLLVGLVGIGALASVLGSGYRARRRGSESVEEGTGETV